jgi:hypothetical protein
VSSLRGSCPDVTFTLSGKSVLADASTKYRKGNCQHLEADRRVSVAGERQPDGRVRAKEIEIKGKD